MIIETPIGIITIEAKYDDDPESNHQRLFHWLVNGNRTGKFIYRNDKPDNTSVREFLKGCARDLKNRGEYSETSKLRNSLFGSTHNRFLITYVLENVMQELAI